MTSLEKQTLIAIIDGLVRTKGETQYDPGENIYLKMESQYSKRRSEICPAANDNGDKHALG